MSTPVLGIMVSEETLYAVLMERQEERTVARSWFARSFGDEEGEPSYAEDSEMGEFGEEEDDVMIQFGDDGASQGGEMFVGSEFDDLDAGSNGTEAATASTFTYELERILKACEDHDFETPEIAFCTAASELDELELHLPPDEGERKPEGPAGLSLPASRSDLFQMVEEQYEGHAEEERVAFVPMCPADDGRHRVLALIARRNGAVLATLRDLKEKSSFSLPKARLFDTEVTTYLALARTARNHPPEDQSQEEEKSLIVRTGEDDTLVLFMKGDTLHQAERLPSLNVDDPPDTICSRVLLLQDEYGIGDIQRVFVIGEEGDEDLVEGFAEFFPDARISGLREVLPFEPENSAGGYVASAGVALRQLDDPIFAEGFQDVNLLPKKYAGSSFEIPVGWAVPALLVLLFLVSLGFVWFYFYNASQIEQKRSQLQALEQEIEQVNEESIRAHIGDLNAAEQAYSQRMEVINSLLGGSNKWSKGLDSIAEQLNDIGGIAVESWAPQGSNEVELRGHATARTRIVRLAERLDGHIVNVVFTEIREWPLYSFTITISLDRSMPEGVQHWRQNRLAALEGGRPSSGGQERMENISGELPSDAGEVVNTVGNETASNGGGRSETSPPVPNWTVVVGSFSSASAAEGFANDFHESLDGYDASLRIWEDSENGRYRVGIGIYESLQDAKAARQHMSDILPSDAWFHEPTATSTPSPIRP